MKLFRRKTEEKAVRQEIAVKEAAPFEGLTEAEAAARAAAQSPASEVSFVYT